MKKLIALALSIAMIATLGVISFAATSIGGETGSIDFPSPNTDTQDISLSINVTDTTNKYRIDIDWTDTKFNLTATREWNVETHRYEYTLGKSENTDTATVKVTNHSDNAVQATLTASKIQGIEGLKIECDPNATIESAVGTSVDNAPNTTLNATISAGSGTIQLEDNSDSFVIATVATLTVTIEKAQ